MSMMMTRISMVFCAGSKLGPVNNNYYLLFTSCWGWLEGWNVLGITRCGVSRCGVSWGGVSWGFIGGSFVSSIRMVVFPVVLTISGVVISPLDLISPNIHRY